MSNGNSSASYKLRSLVTFLHRYKVSSGFTSQGHHVDVPSSKIGSSRSMYQGLRLISGTSRSQETSNTDMLKDGSVKAQSTGPVRSATRGKWLLGSMLSLLLPLWNINWGKLLTLEAKVESVVEEAEAVAEVVEKVATVAEKVSAEVAGELPDNSKLKEAALIAEHLSNVTVKDAQLAEALIHKAGDIKQDLKDMETMVEPLIHEIEEEEHGKS